jgi:hypothetical protein
MHVAAANVSYTGEAQRKKPDVTHKRPLIRFESDRVGGANSPNKTNPRAPVARCGASGSALRLCTLDDPGKLFGDAGAHRSLLLNLFQQVIRQWTACRHCNQPAEEALVPSDRFIRHADTSHSLRDRMAPPM